MTQKQAEGGFESQNEADRECRGDKKVTQEQAEGGFESQNEADREYRGEK